MNFTKRIKMKIGYPPKRVQFRPKYKNVIWNVFLFTTSDLGPCISWCTFSMVTLFNIFYIRMNCLHTLLLSVSAKLDLVKLAASFGLSSYVFLILYSWIFFAIYSANCVVSPDSPDIAITILFDNLWSLFSSRKFFNKF